VYTLKYDRFTVTPGIRYENMVLRRDDYGKNDIDRTGQDLKSRENRVDVFIPGIGLDYKFTGSVSAFAGVHKGFSPPGTTEGTLPEESINYELGTRFSKKSLTGQAVLFLNDYKKLLGSDLAAAGGSGSNEQFNAGEALTRGLELQLTYDFLTVRSLNMNLPVTLAYTYTNATFQESFESNYQPWGSVASGDQLPYLAPNQLAIIMALEHRSFSVNLSGKYMDKMRTVAGQGEIPADAMLDSYFVLDIGGEYHLNPILSVFGSVQNMTNEIYAVARRPAGQRPGMPRFFQLGVKASF